MSAPLDFATFERGPRAKSYLVLPPGFAAASAPDRLSSVYGLAPAALAERVLAIATAEPRVTVTHPLDDAHRFEVKQVSPLFRFPDRVAVQAFAAGGDGAALALYSAARYGITDFGVNLRRVTRWLNALAPLERPTPG